MGVRRIRAGVLATGLAAGAALSAPAGATLLGAGTAGAASPAPDAATLYRQALAATTSSTVHYASTATQSTTTMAVTGDAGPASGSQTVRLGTGTISIFVIGGISYVKGNATGLQKLVGFGASQAAPLAGQWIAFATDNAAFASVVVGVRSADVVKELALHGSLALGHPRTLDGVPAEAIEGTQTIGRRSVPVVLYVRAHGTHVPLEEDSFDTHGRHTGALHVVYSGWGEPVRPLAPSATVTFGRVSST